MCEKKNQENILTNERRLHTLGGYNFMGAPRLPGSRRPSVIARNAFATLGNMELDMGNIGLG